MDEKTAESKTETKRYTFPTKKFLTGIGICIIAFSFGFLHYLFVVELFENDRNFAYLSDTQRELSFRTEMGFYYSYYKTVVEEKPFMAGIAKIMNDRLVEYPNEVNAFNRFNVHPEVMIGALYRYFEPWLNTSAQRQCEMVKMCNDVPPVRSCIGLGVPVYFYLEVIWWLAGLTVTAIFLYATMLSESILGGVIAVGHYFVNHSDCTRVMWAPNERENMAAPLLLLHGWLVSIQLRRRTPAACQLQVSIFILNCLCLLFWQFSQFIFLTQTAIFFVMEQLRIIDTRALGVLLHSQFCGLHMAVLLLQGNDMLKSSLYASFFVVVTTYCLVFSKFRLKIQNRFDLLVESWLVLLRIAIVICTSIYLKKLISNFLEVDEDSHIWDILYSKFTYYKSFHTLIYTCSEVFDFLPLSTFKRLNDSLLFTFLGLSVMNVLFYWLYEAKASVRKKKEEKSEEPAKDANNSEEDNDNIENPDTKLRKRKLPKDLDVIDKEIKSEIKVGEESDALLMFLKHLRVEPAIFYNISQMFVYGVMACLVMRLKLLFVTHMCIVSSLMMNPSYYTCPKMLSKYLLVFMLLAMTFIGFLAYHNVMEELSHSGEYSDVAMDELMEWIGSETSPSAAFAGPMPALAAVMLITRRPIVAHPHYEHREARQRTYAVYKTYGRFSTQEVYQELSKLRATYLIVDAKYCYGRSNTGCTFEDIWHTEPYHGTATVTACHVLFNSLGSDHFYPVFNNNQYAVFKIHDYSVSYMPRSFDT